MVTQDPRPGPPSWELFTTMHASIEGRDPRFQWLGPLEQAATILERFEALNTSSLWNMQRHNTIKNLRDPRHLNDRAEKKGVQMRLILPPRVVHERNPLAASHYHRYLRLGPVAHPLMIGDRRRILIGDPPGDGIWISHDPTIVAHAVDFYEQLWQYSTPAIPEGQKPPFTPRMIQVAFHLVDGATDREIAKALTVSERTVSSEIHEMSRRLGARSRAETIARISGAR